MQMDVREVGNTGNHMVQRIDPQIIGILGLHEAKTIELRNTERVKLLEITGLTVPENLIVDDYDIVEIRRCIIAGMIIGKHTNGVAPDIRVDMVSFVRCRGIMGASKVSFLPSVFTPEELDTSSRRTVKRRNKN